MRARHVLGKRVLFVVLAVSVAGCGAPAETDSLVRLALVLDSSANEVQPGLTSGTVRLVEDAIASDHGSLQVVVDGVAGEPIDLVLRRGGQVEHAEQRRVELSGEVLDRVRGAVAAATGSSGEVDTLGQLTWLARQPGEVTGVVVGSGLQSGGPLGIAALGWDRVGSPGVVDEARARGLLPDLTGKTVVFAGLGDVAGPQDAVPESLRERLAAHWLALCTAAGGECSVDDEPLAGAPRSTVAAPPVAIPAEPAITVPTTAHPAPTVTELPSDLLFAPDSADLLPAARTQLAALAARLPAQAVVTLDGRTASVGPADTARALSLDRAAACRAVLVAAGVPDDRITVHGLGFDAPLVSDLDAQGRLVPAAAQRNRSVTLTVAIGGTP